MSDTKPTMLTYIEQTPEQLKRNVERAEELTGALVDLYALKPRHAIWIVACGSSFNGALCARYFMMKYLKREVKIVPSATFIFGEHDLHEDDFVFVISQSGCSTNSIQALDLLRELGITADTEEVTSSKLVTPTTKLQVGGHGSPTFFVSVQTTVQVAVHI